MKRTVLIIGLAIMPASGLPLVATAQSLEQQLHSESPQALAAAAVAQGDALRGAIVFHQPHFACGKCHSVGSEQSLLGPDLAKSDSKLSDPDIVDSILRPSKSISDSFKTVSVLTDNGNVYNGIIHSQTDQQVSLRDAGNVGKTVVIDRDEIELIKTSDVSLMPAGQVNQLSGRQQFLDLVKYLIEIRDGGPKRSLQLQPPAHLLVAPAIPEYEKTIDHKGLISSLDDDSYKRGEAIYDRLCVNCHGTKDKPGSLPTSLRFADGKFKNGSDPFAMYQTLTRGFGMMLPQTWMVPQQKYDVIHYIRSAYLQPHNQSQLFEITDQYLAGLPNGDSSGPAPVNVEPWVNMDYGPSMVNTFETGDDAKNFAYKGIAVRLDRGPGGVSRGNAWMIFDHDTMRVSTAWRTRTDSGSSSFIDWQGIHFNGRHNIHPRVSGEVHLQNATGPGWADPTSGSFDDPRLVGRDGRIYGPLPNRWAKLHGIYSHGSRTVIDYQISNTNVKESPVLLDETNATIDGRTPTFARAINIGPREMPMTLQVATIDSRMQNVRETDQTLVMDETGGADTQQKAFSFNGGSYAQVEDGDAFDMHRSDFTILARIRTKSDGTIFAKTADTAKWVPSGKTLFIQGGRLTFDIGWVGAVRSKKKVTDGKWHDVAMTWAKSGEVKFFVDGKPSGGGSLKPKKKVSGHVVRIGFTARDFPATSHFDGDLRDLRFVGQAMSPKQVSEMVDGDQSVTGTVAHWTLGSDKALIDEVGGRTLMTYSADAVSDQSASRMAFGVSQLIPGGSWSVREFAGANEAARKRICLTIPAGEQPLRFILWSRSGGFDGESESIEQLASVVPNDPSPDLSQLTQGGPPRWPERLRTTVVRGSDDGPFAVDKLTAPAANPWSARVRLSGFDFFDDNDRMAVCAWDGDVWLVSGLSELDERDGGQVELTWQRIASGLFQPLGLKIVDGRIFVSCRDQICVLNDLNGDGETDFYQCFNRDHQVTDHFHEFAMGLQTDSDGNFYYAKSARHALKALVPHHGTLLRVSKDGSKTDIVANGFRAANGVCLNPDGTFIVTDQEGHWNPKNRINWVEPGGFYGNMFGYHDVSDSSDTAMSQPLCWITNSFDRSPAELLWVDSEKWGPLNKQLLNLSYGYGKVYVVPHEEVDGQKQGGMCEFPIPQFPTGTMRGRFRKSDGQLYICGMFAWAGSQQKDGGLFRLRYTGKPVHLPVELNATKQGMRLSFSGDLQKASAENVDNYAVKAWSLKRTASYGSKHYDERSLEITDATLDPNGRTVTLKIPDIKPTWCMEIRYGLQAFGGKRINGTVHNTIHNLGD